MQNPVKFNIPNYLNQRSVKHVVFARNYVKRTIMHYAAYIKLGWDRLPTSITYNIQKDCSVQKFGQLMTGRCINVLLKTQIYHIHQNSAIAIPALSLLIY